MECFTFTAKVSNTQEMEYPETIQFHLPYRASKTTKYLEEVHIQNQAAYEGVFYNRCKEWFHSNYQTSRLFLTSSCTAALEFAGLLAEFKPGDEVILPSFTFASTANAFLLRGCNIRFADTIAVRPNINLESILPLITKKTKAIVIIHYAGIAVDLDPLIAFTHSNNLLLIEDAAQCFGASYKNRHLGSFGDFASFSFHPSKIIHCGEGGLLKINLPDYINRAEIIFQKGTNLKAFKNHEVDFYEWKAIGSSYGMSEYQAAVLFSQLEESERVIAHHKFLYQVYQNNLLTLNLKGLIRLPDVPEFAQINGCEYYILLDNLKLRSQLQNYLNQHGIQSATHYRALHRSSFFQNKDQQNLVNTDYFESSLLRLPMHFYLTEHDIIRICHCINTFFG